MAKFDEAACLAFNPFAGDFGSPSDANLKDRIVTARVSGECDMCGHSIVPGTRIRIRVDVFDGQLGSYRWCNDCCVAMACDDDDGTKVDARIAMRDRP